MVLAVGGALGRCRFGTSLELATLAAIALATPPLIYFVAYLCGLHSPRHFLDTLAQLEFDRWHGVMAAAPFQTVGSEAA